MEERKLSEKGKQIVKDIAELTADISDLEIDFNDFFEDNDGEE